MQEHLVKLARAPEHGEPQQVSLHAREHLVLAKTSTAEDAEHLSTGLRGSLQAV